MYKNKRKTNQVVKPEIEVMYQGGLTINDFKDHLVEVNDIHRKNKLYVYFNSDAIVNFSKLPDVDQEKFKKICQPENIKFSASINDQGIKYLGHQNGLPQCELRIKDRPAIQSFSHEIKIQGSANRIGVTTLKPLTEGPQILIATHAIKNGFHTNQHHGKVLSASGFFSKTNSENQKQVESNNKEKIYVRI